MSDVTMKQHDTRPILQRYLIQTVNGATLPVDVSAVATVRFEMRHTSAPGVLVQGVASIVTPASAYISYKWGANDTATVGIYNVEYELTYTDGGIETVPGDTYFSIEIVDDLDLP